MSEEGKEQAGEDVVSRLTDPKNYTGASKERFDAEGHGRGHAGRESLVEYDGNTNAATRKAVKSDNKKEKKAVVEGGVRRKKFSVQANVAKKITVFKNGDKHDDGTTVVLVKSITNLKLLLAKCPNPTTGQPRQLFAQDLTSKVKHLSQIRDGGHYIVCGAESVIKDSVSENLAVKSSQNTFQYDIDRVRKDFPNMDAKEVQKAEDTFNWFDLDGSGTLEVSEIQKALKATGTRATAKDLDHVMEEFDADNSGNIDPYEFLAIRNAIQSKKGNANPIMRVMASRMCVVQ